MVVVYVYVYDDGGGVRCGGRGGSVNLISVNDTKYT